MISRYSNNFCNIFCFCSENFNDFVIPILAYAQLGLGLIKLFKITYRKLISKSIRDIFGGLNLSQGAKPLFFQDIFNFIIHQ